MYPQGLLKYRRPPRQHRRRSSQQQRQPNTTPNNNPRPTNRPTCHYPRTQHTKRNDQTRETTNRNDSHRAKQRQRRPQLRVYQVQSRKYTPTSKGQPSKRQTRPIHRHTPQRPERGHNRPKQAKGRDTHTTRHNAKQRVRWNTNRPKRARLRLHRRKKGRHHSKARQQQLRRNRIIQQQNLQRRNGESGQHELPLCTPGPETNKKRLYLLQRTNSTSYLLKRDMLACTLPPRCNLNSLSGHRFTGTGATVFPIYTLCWIAGMHFTPEV